MDVVVANRNAHGVGGNCHAFNHRVRIELHDVAVFAGTRLTFVRVAHQILLPRKLARHKAPLQAGRETRAAATAQARFFDRGNHLVLRQALAAVLAQNLTQGLVAAARLVSRNAPVGTIQIGQDLRAFVAAMKRAFPARGLERCQYVLQRHGAPSARLRSAIN